jgi:H+/Na+-translocating ferredoxin:NAD+ oxidoreductase subunit B
MDGREIYRKLRDKLSAAPSGVPPGDRFLEILETLFNPKEAELALVIPFMPASLSEIAAASRIEKARVERLLMKMADKGVVYAFDHKGETKYLLFSFETIYNYPIKYRSSDIDQTKLRSLWKEYFAEGWDRAPGTYVIPGRVLPVQENLSAESAALPYDIVYKYIDEARYISVGECSCRSIVGNCDSPIETCMGLGYAAKFLVERKLSRPIDKEEARSIVNKAHEAGLVSISNNAKDNIGIICHCCRCCCGQLMVATKFGRYDLRPVGSFVARVDKDSCTSCELCVDRCPMGAISIDDTAVPDPDKCIGCGLCISSCPEESLSLSVRKPSPEVPDDVIDYAMKAVRAQGTEEEFLRELKIRSDD